MSKINFATAYGNKFSTRKSISEYPATRTKQDLKDQCDINKIVTRFKRDGVLNHINANQPIFTDFTPNDYQQCLNKVIDADNAFFALPSNIRERFANDPQRLLAFVQDDSNYEEGFKLGLFNPRPDPDESVASKSSPGVTDAGSPSGEV